MPRPREVIERAERVLEGGVTERSAIEHIAMQYAEVTGEIRARLGQATECARRGLRMEIRSITDARPPLIETAALFATSAAGKWRDFCKSNRLVVPPRISEETITEVQESLNALLTDRFEELHAIFRQQNLALAPCYQRLRTLRLIAKRDPSNPMWAEDVDRFEVDSIRELRAEFAAAIKHGRLEEAQEIVDTFRNEDWVRRDAEQAASRCERDLFVALAAQAVERAEALSQEMFANYMAESFSAVRTNMEEWDALGATITRGGLTPPVGPTSVVAPILDWIVAREAEMQIAHETRSRLDGLERVAVDGSSTADDIQARLVDAERMPGGVPDDLRELAQRRVDEHSARVRVRRVSRFVVMGGVAAAVLVSAIWFTMHTVRRIEQAKFAEAFAAAVDRRDDAECARLLEQSRVAADGFDQDQRVLDAQSRLAEAQQKDVDQDARFESAFAKAGDPSVVDGQSDVIESAAQLARTESQRDRVHAWRQARSAADIRAQQTRDAVFLAQVTSLAAQIDALSALSPQSKESIAQLERIEILAANIGSSTAIGKEARAAFDAQRERIGGSRELAALEAQRSFKEAQASAALATLVASSGDPDRLEQLLREFADAHPDSPFAVDFREAASQAGSWKPVLAWVAKAPTLTRVPFPALAQDRDTIRKAIESFRAKYPASPLDSSLRAYLDLLADSQGWTDWLGNILRTWTPMDLKMIELDTGERYYCFASDRPTASSTTGVDVYTVITSWKDEKKGPVRIERKRIKSEGDSPQAKLRARLLPMIRGVNAATSADGALEVIRAIRDDSAVDPVARAYLINGLLAEMRASLPQHAAEVDRAIGFLGEEELESIDWLAPGNPTKRADYSRIQQLLVNALPLVEWRKAHDAQAASISKWLASRVRAVGILDRTSGDPAVRFASSADEKSSDTLYAVAPSSSAQARIVEVASAGSDRSLRFNPIARTLPSGTVLFAGSWNQGPVSPPADTK